jgi:hypothetical protein
VIIRDGGGGSDTSSASPSALMAYSNTGQRIDGELEGTSVRLGAALTLFEATCREYSTGVTTALADELLAFARDTSVIDVWVGKVAKAFAQADGGGLAGAAALDPSAVKDWSTIDKLKYAIQQAMARLPGDVAAKLQGLLSPENLAAMAAVVGVWGVSQFFGVGEVADAVLIGVGLFTIGTDAIHVGVDLGKFAVGVVRANDASDLDAAGEHLAKAISTAGVDAALALLFHKASKELPEREPVLTNEFVTPEGIVVSVPSAKLPSSPELSSMSMDADVTPSSVLGQAAKNEVLGRDPALAENPAALNRAVDGEVQAWLDDARSFPTPGNSAADAYEIKHTGPLNFEVLGGDEKALIDGAAGTDVLEAKFVSNPDTSPYIPGSKIDPKFRPVLEAKTDNQFRRLAAIVNDPTTPVGALEVITNDERAVPYFESLMAKYNIPGRVVVRP